MRNRSIDNNQMITEAEANRNFSRIAKIADKTGQAVICRDQKPQYVLYPIDENPIFDLTDDEKIEIVAARILKKYHTAFEELAK